MASLECWDSEVEYEEEETRKVEALDKSIDILETSFSSESERLRAEGEHEEDETRKEEAIGKAKLEVETSFRWE